MAESPERERDHSRDPSRDDGPGASLRRDSARRLAAYAAVEEAAHPAVRTPEEMISRARLQVLIESRAIWSAIVGAAFGVLLGLVVFQDHRPPLAGDESIQFYGAVVGGVAAGLAFLLGFSLNTRMANLWLGQRPKLRQLADTVALLVVHASIAVMFSIGIFRLFQEAFIGLTVDTIAGAALLGIVGAAAAYFAFNSAARISAFSLSTLLAVFMISGMLVSMLFAENPFWWHVMFSELGTGQAGLTSFWTFNTTLVVSGLIITTLSAFITRDLEVWNRYLRDEHRDRNVLIRHLTRPRIMMVRVMMIGMGLSLAGVGLVPITVHNEIHSAFTLGFAGCFLALLLGMPYWLPGFPRAFYLVSYLWAGALIMSGALWRPIGYYNLTALELIAAAILFSWLIVFIRNIAALSAGSVTGGPQS
ncbi:hypothetical protein [Nesterenkonia marinintestina]|uniref:hypothetical protein n=1 Tax=Nesterenkonia marinintestina TaxID=2979865 RepID=UPI0021C0710C|nr:hypothetical protein [Nesterenkonia sp. GX14115]